jgi:hypothetical protein
VYFSSSLFVLHPPWIDYSVSVWWGV